MTSTDAPAEQPELTLELAGQAFLTGQTFQDEAFFHAVAAKLRHEDPVHWVEHPDFNPFYVLTKHADILDVELHPAEFLNAPRAILGHKAADEQRAIQGHLVKSLVQMDDPEHRLHRNLTSDWFLPKNLAKLEGRLAELAARSVQQMVDAGGEVDFARDIAMQYPLYVILSILGLPESDYPRMLQLTQELFGAEDPDFKREDDAMASLIQTVADFVAYFDGITADRKAAPDRRPRIGDRQRDRSTAQPIGHKEQLGYYIIAATAGHDTTSNSMSGGMHALIERPDQLARLQADPSLLPTAVDEMIRWTSPVKHFMRTAPRSTTTSAARHVKAGQDVLLSYWSANRDEEVFTDPFSFDVGRTPNKHLAFGFGVHYCLGAMLARMEMKALFGALLPRLKHIELAGEPQLTRSTFVSGHKHLPIRYELS